MPGLVQAAAAEEEEKELSFAENPSGGNEGDLIDGHEENAMCSRQPPQQGKRAAESRSVAGDAGTFQRTGQERMDLGLSPALASPVPRWACAVSSFPSWPSRRVTVQESTPGRWRTPRPSDRLPGRYRDRRRTSPGPPRRSARRGRHRRSRFRPA